MSYWVPVGNPGNAADTSTNCAGLLGSGSATCGSVAYTYFISKYDITNAQYTAFLNAVDPGGSNTLGLWNSNMQTDTSNGGISQVLGNPSGSKYVVNAGFENDPVNYTSFYSALRYANWLNNGKGSSSTETGAYTLLGGTPTPSNGLTVTRNPGAVVALPSENEWYKAAYYDPISNSYFAYPYGTSTQTTCAAPGATPNTANCGTPGGPGQVTPVGAYTGSASPYGTFDQGGDVSQWNEQIVNALSGPYRGDRGGSFIGNAFDLSADTVQYNYPTGEQSETGFRVVTLAPDTDGDGIPDPFDNCRYTPNGPSLGTCLGHFAQGQATCHSNADCTSGMCSLNQEDSGGVGVGSPPDGIGDACQCGDVNNDGIVTNTDATLIKRSFVNLPPYPGGVTTLPGYNKCDVNADGTCNNNDATIIDRTVVDLPPGIQQKCHAATIFP